MNISEYIFNLKYKYKTDNSIDDMWKRVANAIAENENNKEYWSTKFYNLLKDFKFLPAGRIIANAGTNRTSSTMFNCYVMGDIEDSMEGIFDAIKESALTQKQGGGVGYNFSTLRPKGEFVKGVEAYSSGPISFMKIMDTTCQTIMSAGNRRGAMMGILNCDYPDIEEFIKVKQTAGNLEMFNLSIGITDKFMNAVENDKDWDLVFNNKIYKTIKAKELWDKIMESTYDYAEPGIINLDIINKMNNLYYCEKINATNPCGEQNLGPYAACLLGSFNLTQYDIKSEEFKNDIKTAVRFLDNVIDISGFPLEQQRLKAQNYRRMGIGFTGLADYMVMNKVKYGSKESIELTEFITKLLTENAYKASIELAKEKGCFVELDIDKYIKSEFIQKLDKNIIENIKKYGIRNSHLVSIAPTGTISLLANNVSSGIEPIFNYSYTRKIKLDGDKKEDKLLIEDYAYSKLDDKENLSDYWITTSELTPKQHVDIQSVAQKWIDSSISKTININTDYPFEKFKDIYMYAYKKGCKGITTFRHNPKKQGILVDDNCIECRTAEKRGEILKCDIHRSNINGNKWVILIGLKNNIPYEIFGGKESKIDISSKYKQGWIIKRKDNKISFYDLYLGNSVEHSDIIIKNIPRKFTRSIGEYTRLISLPLRHKIPLRFIKEQLLAESNDKDLHLYAFERGIARILGKYIKNGKVSGEKCPECGKDVVYKDGCKSCPECFWSKCN